VYMNYNCTFLDACEINVGPRTLFAPGSWLTSVFNSD
jgi:hypothetical protein